MDGTLYKGNIWDLIAKSLGEECYKEESELVNMADRIAYTLHELGIGKGDSVGVMSGNHPEFLFRMIGSGCLLSLP